MKIFALFLILVSFFTIQLQCIDDQNIKEIFEIIGQLLQQKDKNGEIGALDIQKAPRTLRTKLHALPMIEVRQYPHSNGDFNIFLRTAEGSYLIAAGQAFPSLELDFSATSLRVSEPRYSHDGYNGPLRILYDVVGLHNPYLEKKEK